MNRSRLNAIFVAIMCIFSGIQVRAAGFGEPGPLPLAWTASVDSAQCKEPNRLQAFLESTSKLSDHTVQERMLVSVAYTQGRQLFAALVDIIDVFDREVVAWNSLREHPVAYRLKQAPWRWFKGQSAEQEIEGYLKQLKERRGIFARHLGELNGAMHALRDACEPASDKDLIKNLKQLVDIEHAILTPTGHQSLAAAEISAISVRIIENMGKSVHYKRTALRSFKELNIPGHLRRNALTYVAGTLGLVALGVYAYNKRDKIVGLNQKLIQQFQQWNVNFKKKFENLKDSFFSKNKGDDKLTKLTLDMGQKIDANVIALEKDAVASVMLAGIAKTEQQAQEMVTKSRLEGKLAVLLNECKTKRKPAWHSLPSYGDDILTIYSAIAYDKIDPVLRGIEIGLGEYGDLKRQHIRSNELTSAVISLIPEIVTATAGTVFGTLGLRYVYRVLTSQEQWSKTIRSELIRTRTLLDHSGSDAMSEAERQGMIIYALHHLQKEAYGVPTVDRKRFEADLMFLQRSDISDEYKVQRIDSFLGPYKFLKV